MVSRNYRVETKLHGRGVKFRETIKITKKHRKWFRETRVNSKKSGFVGVSNSHLFGFIGASNSKIGPTLTLLNELQSQVDDELNSQVKRSQHVNFWVSIRFWRGPKSTNRAFSGSSEPRAFSARGSSPAAPAIRWLCHRSGSDCSIGRQRLHMTTICANLF